jgi:DNA-binding SARP family transcriptional activator
MHFALGLPTGYRLVRDSHTLTLCRSDGSIVARFSSVGTNQDEVRKAAEQDYLGTIYNHEAPIPDAVTDQLCLQVRFFGNFEIFCNGELLNVARHRKALTIFKYLLAHRERRVSQDHLMEWLWPKSTPYRARRSLNMAIWTLRNLLRECSADLKDCILLEDGYYRLCPTIRWVTDVEEFDLRFEEGRRVEDTNRIETAAQYQKAIELYRGEYLLEHLYEDWTMFERERLSNAYMNMLEWLAMYYKETEHLRESIRICCRIMERERAHEKCHLLLTEVYVLLGLYGRASHQYRLFKRVLKSTYGMDPSVETKRRFEKVLGRL